MNTVTFLGTDRRRPTDEVRSLMNQVDTRRTAPGHLVAYEFASIHEGVAITELLRALVPAGMTASNVAGRLVIHRIGQDPCAPARQVSR